MRRGGTSRARVRAFAAPLVAALLAGPTATGCGATGSGHADRAPSAGADGGRTTTPSPRVTSDEDLCTKLVGHWSRKVLDGRTYGDYQSMGLSGGQYDILREVVDSARAAERQGVTDVGRLIDREAREGCVEWYRAGGPGEGPWR
ncbi:hypothetical protein SUDANB15_01953 [Streptomyces sp. enrichment culture]|uniref:hypothetical protein n=1 Tax=Streptomyces sp. enrichment culture TaxID=1795815 RepID=UPI003F57DC27